MQAEQENSFSKYNVTQFRASMYLNSRKAQISAALIHIYSSSGIILPMLTCATLTSNHKAIGRSGGCVTSVQMGTNTVGKHVCTIGPMALVALSAQAGKCASTTPWLPRLL